MQYIEFIEDFVPDDPNTNLPITYPKSGIYRTKGGLLYLVNKESSLSCYIGNSIAFSKQENSSIDQDFLLKVIAVTQSPVLATQLIKGN